MKKETVRSLIVLAIGLAVYHLVVFLIPFKRETVFWITYVFSLGAAALVYAACYIGSVSQPNAKSRFYGFPIIRIGAIYGIFQAVVGLVFMAIGKVLPWQAAVLVFGIALAAAALGLISAEAVIDGIQAQDAKLKKDVALMRALQSKLNQMGGLCEDPEAAKAVSALAEEMRYSDPVSSEAAAEAEADLAAAVDALQQAVVDNDSSAVRELCRKAALTLAERNRICKLNKQ